MKKLSTLKRKAHIFKKKALSVLEDNVDPIITIGLGAAVLGAGIVSSDTIMAGVGGALIGGGVVPLVHNIENSIGK